MAITPIKFEKNAIMEWNGNKITDHNRSELDVSVERIETTKRMANGIMRKYVVADKRSFSVSWDELPFSKDFTVDGFWGGREIEDFYNNNVGPFTLKITNGDGKTESFTVMMTDFSKRISKRGAFDMWNVGVELEEV